jgi:4-hydroxy-tetrahydrodipicolinate synthase
MAEYTKSEAREWARENMKGVANVVIPTFTQDLLDVSEAATRFDIRHEIELGFWGTLLVSETATTLDEYERFTQWAVDESKGRLRTIHHSSFNTLDEAIRAGRAAQAAGVDLVLLSYPPTFYPTSQRDIINYTEAYCNAVDLGVILFPVPLWGFERLHPAGIAPEAIAELVRDVPNLVAIKAEGGMPTIGGFVECYRRFHDQVIVTHPLEADALLLKQLVDIPFMGTSNYEYFGPLVPRVFRLIDEGKLDEAMDLYWTMHPARLVNQAMASVPGANFLHRMLWKYQGWLNGFNGGPLRAPTMRLNGNQMKALRKGLVDCGFDVTPDDDSRFFIGRNPE